MKNYPAQVDPQWINSIGFSDFPGINSKNWNFFTNRDFWYLHFPVDKDFPRAPDVMQFVDTRGHPEEGRIEPNLMGPGSPRIVTKLASHLFTLKKRANESYLFSNQPCIWLVVSIPLKNMKVSWDYENPNIWKK